MKKIVNNQEIEMTEEEVLEKETENAEYLEDIQAQKTEIENEKIKKESGKQKLKDLGLDDDEINALLGV
tara:strand:+ start:409 stop:615 length:207 start_codon:yes stop_codon:yes gene_type:complete